MLTTYYPTARAAYRACNRLARKAYRKGKPVAYRVACNPVYGYYLRLLVL